MGDISDIMSRYYFKIERFFRICPGFFKISEKTIFYIEPELPRWAHIWGGNYIYHFLFNIPIIVAPHVFIIGIVSILRLSRKNPPLFWTLLSYLLTYFLTVAFLTSFHVASQHFFGIIPPFIFLSSYFISSIQKEKIRNVLLPSLILISPIPLFISKSIYFHMEKAVEFIKKTEYKKKILLISDLEAKKDHRFEFKSLLAHKVNREVIKEETPDFIIVDQKLTDILSLHSSEHKKFYADLLSGEIGYRKIREFENKMIFWTVFRYFNSSFPSLKAHVLEKRRQKFQ